MTTRLRFLSLLFLLAVSSATAAAKPRPIQVKVVVVTMFEVGNDTGDAPGELQYWVERDHLDRLYDLPSGYHAVRMNGQGEMAVLTGPGTAHAASTIMAVGLDPRFDFMWQHTNCLFTRPCPLKLPLERSFVKRESLI